MGVPRKLIQTEHCTPGDLLLAVPKQDLAEAPTQNVA